MHELCGSKFLPNQPNMPSGEPSLPQELRKVRAHTLEVVCIKLVPNHSRVLKPMWKCWLGWLGCLGGMAASRGSGLQIPGAIFYFGHPLKHLEKMSKCGHPRLQPPLDRDQRPLFLAFCVDGNKSPLSSRRQGWGVWGLVWSGLVWSGLVWSGLVWSGLVWSGLVWSGLVWSGLVWSGLVWSGLVWSGLVWSGLVWSGLVWSGLVWSGLVWSGQVRSGQVRARLGWAGLGWAGLGWAWRQGSWFRSKYRHQGAYKAKNEHPALGAPLENTSIPR